MGGVVPTVLVALHAWAIWVVRMPDQMISRAALHRSWCVSIYRAGLHANHGMSAPRTTLSQCAESHGNCVLHHCLIF